MCTEQCLRRDLHYESHTEFCMAKCYDTAYIYIRTGIAELTDFTYDNNIKSWLKRSLNLSLISLLIDKINFYNYLI